MILQIFSKGAVMVSLFRSSIASLLLVIASGSADTTERPEWIDTPFRDDAIAVVGLSSVHGSRPVALSRATADGRARLSGAVQAEIRDLARQTWQQSTPQGHWKNLFFRATERLAKTLPLTQATRDAIYQDPASGKLYVWIALPKSSIIRFLEEGGPFIRSKMSGAAPEAIKEAERLLNVMAERLANGDYAIDKSRRLYGVKSLKKGTFHRMPKPPAWIEHPNLTDAFTAVGKAAQHKKGLRVMKPAAQSEARTRLTHLLQRRTRELAAKVWQTEHTLEPWKAPFFDTCDKIAEEMGTLFRTKETYLDPSSGEFFVLLSLEKHKARNFLRENGYRMRTELTRAGAERPAIEEALELLRLMAEGVE